MLVTALAAVAGVAIPSAVALRERWPEGTEGLKSLPSPGPVQSAIVGPSGTAEHGHTIGNGFFQEEGVPFCEALAEESASGQRGARH